MFNQNSPERDPDHHSQPQDLKSPQLPMEAEPAAIANMCDHLLGFEETPLTLAIERARGSGPLTANKFTGLVREHADIDSLKFFAMATELFLREKASRDMAVCIPAVVHVARHLLTYSGSQELVAKSVVERMLFSLTHQMGKDEAFYNSILGGLDAQANDDLLQAVNDGDQLDKGYWSCLELQTLSEPSLTNLQRLFDAHELIRDQLPSRSLPSQVLFRVVGTVAEQDFEGVFDLVVSEFKRCQEKSVKHGYDLDMLDYAVSGLAVAALKHLDDLNALFSGDDLSEFHVAAKVAIAVGGGLDPRPPAEARLRIREVIRDLIEEDAVEQFGNRESFVVLAHRVLSAVTDSAEDLALVQSFIERALGREPGAEYIPLLDEFAEACERVFDIQGIDPLPPVPTKAFKRLIDGSVWGRCAEAFAPASELSGADLNNRLADMAASVIDLKKQQQVFLHAAEIETLVKGNPLEPRLSEEGSVFIKASEAHAFSKRFALFVLSGYHVAGAALLPEALSILKGSEERDGKGARKAEETYENLGASLTELALCLTNNEDTRRIAAARLSAADWRLLRSLHRGATEYDLGDAAEVVALAALSLRAALEPDTLWHQDFLETASADEHDERYFMTPCYIAERRRQGDSWKILEQLDLREHTHESVIPIASGIQLSLPDSYPKLFSLLSSEKAEEVTKGLLLAQSLRYELHEEQREECRRMALHYLDEPGQLGLDALVTYSCFAEDSEAAREINQSRKPIGVDLELFLVTRLVAAGRALRNNLLGFSTVEEMERDDLWGNPDFDV